MVIDVVCYPDGDYDYSGSRLEEDELVIGKITCESVTVLAMGYGEEGTAELRGVTDTTFPEMPGACRNVVISHRECGDYAPRVVVSVGDASLVRCGGEWVVRLPCFEYRHLPGDVGVACVQTRNIAVVSTIMAVWLRRAEIEDAIAKAR